MHVHVLTMTRCSTRVYNANGQGAAPAYNNKGAAPGYSNKGAAPGLL